MNFAGFTLEAYIATALLLVIAVVIFTRRPDNEDKSLLKVFRKPLVRISTGIVFVAAAIGLLFIPATHMSSVEGSVVSVEPHGDGSGSEDYSVIDLDHTNVALVVMRSDMPEVTQGDSVKLRCKTTSEDKVYLCHGSVSSGSTPKR